MTVQVVILETAIFQALYERYGSQLALSMEMFESDCQLALNEYLQGYIPEDRMLKDARPWNNYMITARRWKLRASISWT